MGSSKTIGNRTNKAWTKIGTLFCNHRLIPIWVWCMNCIPTYGLSLNFKPPCFVTIGKYLLLYGSELYGTYLLLYGYGIILFSNFKPPWFETIGKYLLVYGYELYTYEWYCL
uniref:Uncharacterized protein n=1 Tax=Cacopsylla melanoneura TaxID=428564 RepID=A0A8D8SDF8_9HEMI